ncbi:MAG: (2Fe-2S)-binding protein [Planctomycetota bacterium]|jgi:bacterioferritin-associated ferredoxin
MPVDRCVCHDVTFAQMREYARQERADFDALRRRFGCGSGCGLCVPYVRAMLRTGRTRFPAEGLPNGNGNDAVGEQPAANGDQG